MTGKYKGHRHTAINVEAIFAVLSIIPYLQVLEPIVIESFFEIIVTSFSSMKYETYVFNTNLTGFKKAIPNV